MPLDKLRTGLHPVATWVALPGLVALLSLPFCKPTLAQTPPPASPAIPMQTQLKVGTATDYPPFEYRVVSGGNSEIVGFDIELAQYLGQRLGFKVKLQDMEFTTLIPALQAGKLDFAISAMTPTAERRQKVDFSVPYFESRDTIVAHKGSNLRTFKDLMDKTVGVQEGTIQERQIQSVAKTVRGLEVVRIKRIPDLIQAIKDGKIAAAIIEDMVVATYVEDNPDLEFTVIAEQEPVQFAIALPKGSAMVEQFNRVIQDMKASGEMELLVRRWFAPQQ